MSARTDDIGSPTRPIGNAQISRVPYLPGLDGMRALAVVAVMVYHANHTWLKGGFFGVEVFFVISGYLITLLLIAEKERTDTVDMKQFWMRRARRLLPALFVMLFLLTVWTAIFKRAALGKLRGDIVGAVTYSSNWYQIYTGAGYSSANDFAPLRHLWSLAVEEQFYLIWPIVMFFLLTRGSRHIANLSRWLVIAALGVAVVMALAYHHGPIGTPEVTPGAYWHVFGRNISKADFLYLSSFFRLGGLLLGSAFAMVWRPVALMRGPMRTKAPLLDGLAVIGVGVLALMMWKIGFVDAHGADPWLFRGGFLLASIASLAVIAAVTHPLTIASKAFSAPILVWLGVRSYGLYLFHWPVYQVIRGITGINMTFVQFAFAMVVTLVITEGSYRLIETPIRKGTFGASWNRMRESRDPGRRNAVLAGAFVGTVLAIFAGTSLVTAQLKQNDVAVSLKSGGQFTCDVVNDPTCGSPVTTTGGATVGSVAPTSPAGSVVVDPLATTVAPTTSTTLPPAPIPRLAIGDSVMLGASQQLKALGFVVDAVEGRAFINGVDAAQKLQSQGRLGDIVVIHLGTNGPIKQGEMDKMMAALAAVPKVLLITNDLPADPKYSFLQANNALIYDTAAKYPNVELLDWSGLKNTCPGNCIYSDGIHLRPDGQKYYASLIAGQLGLS
jgi:peptidoglycan/LPS O-acetylase OafA/YrhL